MSDEATPQNAPAAAVAEDGDDSRKPTQTRSTTPSSAVPSPSSSS
ncbi:hypothetical protein [Planosporangium mesophilum]|nr:hypothetical protein [Planosporangium mesophilum]